MEAYLNMHPVSVIWSMTELCQSLHPIIGPLVLFEEDEMLQEIIGSIDHCLKLLTCSGSRPCLEVFPPLKPDTRSHVPNLSNDLEKRVFLVAIKDTITVPKHSPWGWIESSQWLWQLSITQGGVSVTPEGMNPVRHLDTTWPARLL